MVAGMYSIEEESSQEELNLATILLVAMEQAMDKKTWGCLKEGESVTLKDQQQEGK